MKGNKALYIMCGIAVIGSAAYIFYKMKQVRDGITEITTDVKDFSKGAIDTLDPTRPAMMSIAEGVGYTYELATNYPYQAKLDSVKDSMAEFFGLSQSEN